MSVERDEECPICYKPFSESTGDLAQNAIECPRGHSVCTTCARSLVRPSKSASSASGLGYKCPLCRSEGILTRLQILALIKGEWKQAYSCFQTREEKQEWLQGSGVTPPCQSAAISSF